jgi:hypothetical protein
MKCYDSVVLALLFRHPNSHFDNQFVVFGCHFSISLKRDVALVAVVKQSL